MNQIQSTGVLLEYSTNQMAIIFNTGFPHGAFFRLLLATLKWAGHNIDFTISNHLSLC